MHQDTIIKPIISEKSMNDAALSKFTFKVAKDANKRQIGEIVKNKYKVDVVSVSTSIVKGKKRRSGTRRTEVKSSSWKKAIVTLLKGQKIEAFDVAGATQTPPEDTHVRKAAPGGGK